MSSYIDFNFNHTVQVSQIQHKRIFVYSCYVVFLYLAIKTTNLLKTNLISLLHWSKLMTATSFDPYLDHHQAVFLNTSLIIE
jgi:hypothetical protein